MEECVEAFSKAGKLRALEVHLSIAGHQQLHGLKLCIAGRKCRTAVDELIGQVLDCVTENLKRMASLGGNLAAAFGADADGGY